MKRTILAVCLMIVLSLCACSGKEPAPDSQEGEQTVQTEEQTADDAEIKDQDNQTEEVIAMNMTINDVAVRVKWENNESVRALMKMAEESPVIINMSMYGGFEQVGSLGTTLPSNDQNIKTKPGDIVL
ncbi:MAG: hypothetical protein IJJ31_00195, partial [Mogibacterium sp.]|nr:hypothetical protein [Mogibacterium sp.]